MPESTHEDYIQLLPTASLAHHTPGKKLLTDWTDLLTDYHYIPPIGSVYLLGNTEFSYIEWKHKVLCYAAFFKSKLNHTIFYRCTLESSDFFDSFLRKVLFYRGQLVRVNFKQARLNGIDFMGSRLERCTMLNATITGSKFHSVLFDSVDFTQSRFRNTQFIRCHIYGQSTKLDGTYFENIRTRHCTFWNVSDEVASVLLHHGFVEQEWTASHADQHFEIVSNYYQSERNASHDTQSDFI